MTPTELVNFIREQPWAVQASADASGAPQAAVIGVAVTDELELVFDTVNTTRKCANLRRDPRVALVIGWDEGQTVQYEGIADEPTSEELERRLLPVYLAKFPDGEVRRSWPDITYFRVRPRWIRYSDFRGETPQVVERHFESTSTSPPRKGFHSVTPRIVSTDADGQVAFLRSVFEASGDQHPDRPAEMRIGDSVIMVSEAGARDAFSAFLYVYVDDVDGAYRRALEAGGVSLEAPLETPYGDRRAMVRDPFGNVWQIAYPSR